MPTLRIVAQFGSHDLGNVLDETGKKIGIAMRCLSNKEKYSDSISVNIDTFQSAVLLGIMGILFVIDTPTVKKKRFRFIQEAVKIMEHARQLDGADFKIVTWRAVEGIPDQEDFVFDEHHIAF
ncbi:MAG TPA: hypothetical protein VGE97_08890 [Nitrososphaera sp.]|jgi:hypothetical protein